MNILPLHPVLTKYLRKHQLEKKFAKQQAFLRQNPFYPSLHTELLEPRHLRIWSFRIDLKTAWGNRKRNSGQNVVFLTAKGA